MNRHTTKDRIIEIADRIFYERGYEFASFSDIASTAGISRGNVTFHFRTKDDILEAVIDHRLNKTRMLLDKWEADGEACMDRIASFIDILIVNRTKIMLHGCPVGTLCSELAKLEHASLAHANRVFILFKDWLSRQFSRLGHSAAMADTLALHLLARSQGIATLANAFRDEEFIRREVKLLHAWLHSIAGAPAGRKDSRIS